MKLALPASPRKTLNDFLATGLSLATSFIAAEATWSGERSSGSMKTAGYAGPAAFAFVLVVE
jgi:hypothetical protein